MIDELSGHGLVLIAMEGGCDPLPGAPRRGKRRAGEARQLTTGLQGERDRLGAPADFPENVDLAVVPDADHSFTVPRRAVLSQQETYDLIVEAVVEWITARVA